MHVRTRCTRPAGLILLKAWKKIQNLGLYTFEGKIQTSVTYWSKKSINIIVMVIKKYILLNYFLLNFQINGIKYGPKTKKLNGIKYVPKYIVSSSASSNTQLYIYTSHSSPPINNTAYGPWISFSLLLITISSKQRRGEYMETSISWHNVWIFSFVSSVI